MTAVSKHQDSQDDAFEDPVRDPVDDPMGERADEQVPRAPATTTKPYPPEADPLPDDDTPAAEVAGEQTDPQRRTEVFPEDPAGR